MATAAIPQERTGEVNPWLIAATVMLATFMEVLDTSVANVSLPHIAGNLSASVDESTWVLTSYLVSNAIILPLTGWFSNVFGRKRFYIACVVVFTISSFFCGLSISLPMLVFFRVIQGAGGGGLQPISQAILVDSFPREKQGMAMAVYGMGVIVAPTIGPTLGGWITDNFTWRWIFFINIPVGIASVLMTSLLIRKPKRAAAKRKLKIDYIGIALLSVGVGFMQVALDKGQRDDWFASDFIVAAIALAVVALVSLVIWELLQKEPVIDLRLLRERNFGIAVFTMYILGFVLYGTTVLLPILLQTLLGYTAMQSGLVLLPGGVIMIGIMPIVGWALGKFEARWLVILGLIITAAGLFLMTHFDLQMGMRAPVVSWIVSRCGVAFLFVPINVIAFYFVAPNKTNDATGIINLARNVGGSMGISFVTTLLDRGAQSHQSILAAHITPANHQFQAAIQGLALRLMAQGSSAVHALHQAERIFYMQLQGQAMMLSFLDDFRIMALVCIAMIPFMLTLKKAKPGKARVVAH